MAVTSQSWGPAACSRFNEAADAHAKVLHRHLHEHADKVGVWLGAPQAFLQAAALRGMHFMHLYPDSGSLLIQCNKPSQTGTHLSR
jgi:hypothetical protein